MRVRDKDTQQRRRLPGLSVKDGFMMHPYDMTNGVQTSGLVVGRHLKTGNRHDRHCTAYYGVAPSVFSALLRRWRRTRPAVPIEDFTFVDIGAGMGRAMLLASGLPFRAVLGVELHPTLARRAKRNLSLWCTAGRAKAPMRLYCQDAAEFAFPTGPCVAFLFNPFGATVMRRFTAQIARSFSERPGQLDLLYVNNEQDGVLECQRGFARLFIGEVQRSRADAKADRAILTNQPDGEYASADYEDCSIWRWVGKPARRPRV